MEGHLLSADAPTPAQVTTQIVHVTSVTATPSPVAQHGIVHYKVELDTYVHEYKIDWQRKPAGGTSWTTFGPDPGQGPLEFDNCEETLGTFDIRAVVTPGNDSMFTTVTVAQRPKKSKNVDYFTHWASNNQSDKWVDGTLSVVHPAVGQRTCYPKATITLALSRAAGADPVQFGEIGNFSFTFAGHYAGESWHNYARNVPLQSNGAAEPTYTVSFLVALDTTLSPFTFELYAEQPAGWDLWQSVLLGGPSLEHATLWKLTGSIAWARDEDGTFTSISASNLGGTQARKMPTVDQNIPIRSIDHDQ